ncbi:hypothetical protein EV702DRAFT_1147807 [Suillus placidus]|uniref:BTB domain-containing protein n=1 Tax=Suillus placidus TaxID=48579 RepID=A0A9P7CX63_9AGAM|nr:hypothetical protein EV702DRAFT_1147807 [Suillus placidus]
MSETQEISTAPAPFNNPDHDIVLRSVDAVDFHNFKLILSLVSPIFKDMFTLPQNESEPAVPIIPVTEPSTILYPLLLLSYPSASADPVFNSIDDARDLIATQFLPTYSLNIYAVSCLAGCQHHARIAAARSLEIKGLGRPSSGFAGMGAISAFDYHRLLKYHYECGIAAQAVGKSLEWLPSTPSINDMRMWRCHICRRVALDRPTIQIASFGKLTINPWFEEYLVASGRELAARPCELTILESVYYDRAIAKARDCLSCRVAVHHDLATFRNFYITEVKKAIAKVILLIMINSNLT